MLGGPLHKQLGAPLVQEVLVQDVRMEVTVMQRSVRDVTVRFPCTDLSFLIILKKKKSLADLLVHSSAFSEGAFII